VRSRTISLVIESKPPPLPTETQARKAFDAIAPLLEAIPEAAITRPHADPFAAAATALLVASKVGDEGRDLARMARALVALLRRLGDRYLPEDAAISDELLERGRSVRTLTIRELESAVSASPEMNRWIEAVKKGEGPVDLVFDLRTLAELCRVHRASLRAGLDELPAILLAAADAIELAVRSSESDDQADARDSLGRLWTLFVPEYARIASLGTFPPLALVAANQRAKRRAVVDLEVGFESETNFYVGFTEELTAEGLFVATYSPKPIGSRVALSVTLPDGEKLEVPAIVKWTRDPNGETWPGMGMEFERVSPEDETRIAKFLSMREPLFYA
jgi:uncharacterized protein (TIGR02266 family)